MASLSLSLSLSLLPARSQSPPLILGFSSTPQIHSTPILKLSPSSSTLRCKVSRRLQINQKLWSVPATNPNSVGGKSPNEGSDVKETSNAGQGPPFLTILAGLAVFLLITWFIGSIVVWLLSLIVNLPPPK
ncbi:uncharacterized protein LOC130749638 [Lotus japonicus]|uniref:Uncharacterized protein n=1 Tax=Lotus japonicus TaxID=34305 RepID=I3T621_LOTJA|nr:uncharacterized protein LOC130749638 [Lotus japonicus]AFK47963.1 unknown [Lotus japonicus]